MTVGYLKYIVYTDGSGGASGPGGIAYVAIDEQTGEVREGALPLERATNQKAEILAAAYALHSLPVAGDVTVVSDSEYVVKGFTEWLPRWRQNGWRTRDNQPVKNVAYWQRLERAAARHATVSFEWCEGHAGIEHNERADQLAGEARQMAKDALGSAA
jgi:ribonuclease HI